MRGCRSAHLHAQAAFIGNAFRTTGQATLRHVHYFRIASVTRAQCQGLPYGWTHSEWESSFRGTEVTSESTRNQATMQENLEDFGSLRAPND